MTDVTFPISKTYQVVFGNVCVNVGNASQYGYVCVLGDVVAGLLDNLGIELQDRIENIVEDATDCVAAVLISILCDTIGCILTTIFRHIASCSLTLICNQSRRAKKVSSGVRVPGR